MIYFGGIYQEDDAMDTLLQTHKDILRWIKRIKTTSKNMTRKENAGWMWSKRNNANTKTKETEQNIRWTEEWRHSMPIEVKCKDDNGYKKKL